MNTRVLYTRDEYQELLSKVGFSDVQVEIKNTEAIFSREQLKDWLQPIVSKNLPEDLQEVFLEQLLDEMTLDEGFVDDQGNIHTFTKNTQAVAYS